MAQKFLRQISMFVGNSQLFPTLFVVDLNFEPAECDEVKVRLSSFYTLLATHYTIKQSF